MYHTDIPAWQERFGWFWYNDDMIFNGTEESIEAAVKQYADTGITTLIGFTCTHFRFSFMNYMDKIHETIRMIVEKCHKYGIKYVEHHSCSLVFKPETEKDMEAVTAMFQNKGSSLRKWPEVMETLQDDPMINGHHLSEMSQIDGSTGKLARTRYGGTVMCYNNPYFREAYFQYLEKVYALGVDGIMTDDVQYFGNDKKGRFNACTCKFCREKFKKTYGYDLPQPEEWDDFYDNYDNPVFVAWKKFKIESTSAFIHDVNRHYESLGLQMMRPNYISDITNGNPTAYPFEQGQDIWDFVFQENCAFDIISASFPDFACEAIHRYAMGEQRGCPSMSMFYPTTPDNLYFSWALSKCWGQLYLQTSTEGHDMDILEKKYRKFEKDHADFFNTPKKYTDVAFLYSTNTRESTALSKSVYTPGFRSWLQASYLSGFGTDLVFETDSVEVMHQKPAILSAYMAMLSDETLQNLSAYVNGGGKLLICGDFGKYDLFGKERTEEEVHAFFGDWAALVTTGKIVLLAEDSFSHTFQKICATDRCRRDTEWVPSAEYVVDKERAMTGRTLLKALGKKKVTCTSRDDVLASAFRTPCGTAVHLIRITEVIKKEGEPIAHFKELPAFCDHALPCSDVMIEMQCPHAVQEITAYTPEREDSVSLPFRQENGVVAFTVPEGTFAGYCMMEIK